MATVLYKMWQTAKATPRETWDKVRKLPPEVIDSILPHAGDGLRFLYEIIKIYPHFNSMKKNDAFKIALKYCDDRNFNISQKAKFMSRLPKSLKKSSHSIYILKEASDLITEPQETYPLEEKWARTFFERARKSNAKDYKLMGKLLADCLTASS